MGLFDNFLQQVATGDQIKDYKHASRLFVDNNYALSPKYSWLFHVFFDLNPALTTLDTQTQMEAGMLVKSTDLPKFRIDAKTYNNYNRPTIAQSKARFEDIQITFHDDSSDVTRKLWYDYYNFYYRDMDNSYGDGTGSLNPIYQAPNKQVLGRRDQFNKFGYTPRSYDFNTRYINAIRIYSLHQKRFSEYTLINPVITNYRHGNQNTSSDSTLDHTMTISYETVLYASGNAQAARGGFAQLHYDKSPSPLTPLGGGTNSIAGPGGILSAINETINLGSGGNFGGAAFTLLRGYQKNKNIDIRNLATQELTGALFDIANGKDPRDRTFIPYGGIRANAPAGSTTPFNSQTTAAAGSASSNGSNVTAGGILTGVGIAAALSGEPTIGAGLAIAGLVVNSQTKKVEGGDVNKVVTVEKTDTGLTAVDAAQLAPYSFAGLISNGLKYFKAKATAEETKRKEENIAAGAQYSAYYSTGPGKAALKGPVFETSTNNVVEPSSPYSQTPYAGFNFAAGSDVANQVAAENITQPAVASVTGYQSTNPIPGIV